MILYSKIVIDNVVLQLGNTINDQCIIYYYYIHIV